jgi:YHS domain-containing protein
MSALPPKADIRQPEWHVRYVPIADLKRKMSCSCYVLIASILIVGFAGSAYAVTGQFGNMCSWGLANQKDVQTDCSVNAAIKGKTYCFSSADAKSQFMKNPSVNLTKAESFYKSEHKG